jgi:hypothetical protein
MLDDLQQQLVFFFASGLGLRQCVLDVPFQARDGFIRGRLPVRRQLPDLVCSFFDELQFQPYLLLRPRSKRQARILCRQLERI